MTEKAKANVWTIVNSLAILALLIDGAYYVFFEKPWLSYPQPLFPVMAQSVRAGDVLPLLVERCSSAPETRVYTTARQLDSVDTLRSDPAIVPGTAVAIAPGCHQSVSRINMVPIGTPPGRYQFSGFAMVEGTIRTTIVPWKSQPFDVIP